MTLQEFTREVSEQYPSYGDQITTNAENIYGRWLRTWFDTAEERITVSLWTGEWTVLGRDRSGKGDTLLVAINNAAKARKIP